MPTSLSLVVIGWLAGWWLVGRPRPLPGVTGHDTVAVGVDVVIPARNEEAQLPRLLAALGRQSMTPERVIVVDDESEDGTRAAAREGAATLLAAGPTPRGWTGKSWACWQGATSGSADVVVFLDADTDPKPDLLERLVAEQQRRGGLVSAQPFHRMVAWRERLAAVFNIVAVMGVGCGRSRSRTVGAFGPCLACERAEYVALGGHQAIASSVIDDVALAEHFASHGRRVTAHVGRGAIEFRMYPTGVRAMVEGFAKNFASGAGLIPPARTLAIATWVTSLLSAVVMMAETLSGGSIVGAVVFAAVVFQIHVFLLSLGNFGIATSVLYPFCLALFLAVFAWSLVGLARGRVRWKGRTVSLRKERP